MKPMEFCKMFPIAKKRRIFRELLIALKFRTLNEFIRMEKL